MKQEVIDALHKQIEKERDAAITYEALALWCSANDFSGFAEFFKMQVAEEREHAEKLEEHLLDRGVLPILGAVSAPPSNFESLSDIASTALAHEKSNTAGVLEAYEVAVAHKDYPAKLVLEWFIKEQVEEEAWANKMVALVARCSCAGGIYSLDRHIVKELTGE